MCAGRCSMKLLSAAHGLLHGTDRCRQAGRPSHLDFPTAESPSRITLTAFEPVSCNTRWRVRPMRSRVHGLGLRLLRASPWSVPRREDRCQGLALRLRGQWCRRTLGKVGTLHAHAASASAKHEQPTRFICWHCEGLAIAVFKKLWLENSRQATAFGPSSWSLACAKALMRSFHRLGRRGAAPTQGWVCNFADAPHCACQTARHHQNACQRQPVSRRSAQRAR